MPCQTGSVQHFQLFLMDFSKNHPSLTPILKLYWFELLKNKAVAT